MKKKIILGILLLALAGSTIIIYQWNKPKRTANDEKPAAMLRAEDLYEQFSTDEVTANKAYLNKIIQVTGKVLNTENNATESVIYLETSDALGTISCTLIPGNPSTVKTGTEISVKGICTGYLTDVVLTQCALVQ